MSSMISRRDFIETVWPTLRSTGYVRSGAVFHRQIRESINGIISFGFFGSKRLMVAVTIGVRFEKVEEIVQEFYKINNFEIDTGHLTPTVFEQLSDISTTPKRINQENELIVSRDSAEQIINSLNNFGFDFVNMLSSLDYAAEYSLNSKTLAYGHHAYRIPIVLGMNGRIDDATRFMVEMSGRRHLGSYERFCNYVREKWSVPPG